MSNTSSMFAPNAPAARRLRAASPALHGGASSLLRLARGGETRLPSSAALSGWAERAAAMLDLTPMMVGTHTPARPEAPWRGEAPPRHAVRGVNA
ncbi:MAG TPA: hypothetical protein PKB14_02845 [Rubrivivax sp.]|nr:hypothetical protein [Rubrivivax sp.]